MKLCNQYYIMIAPYLPETTHIGWMYFLHKFCVKIDRFELNALSSSNGNCVFLFIR